MSVFLRPVEKKILALIESDAQITDLDLAKKLKLQVHNVRYALKNMESSGLIQKAVLVNVKGLGLAMHNIFFSLAAEQQKKRQQILNAIQNAQEITWLGEFGGDFQYGLGLAVSSFEDVRSFLEKLSEKFGRVFFEKQVCYQYNSLRYSRKYLDTKVPKTKGLPYYTHVKTFDYDQLDIKILTAMQDHGALSDRALAQQVGVPLSTLKLRIAKLEKAGVISGYVYVVDYNRLGVEQFKLLVYSRGYSSAFRDRLTTWSQLHPNVIGFIECFGAWDYEINLEVENHEQVITITQELYESFGEELSLIKTLTRFRNLKLTSLPGSM